MNTKVDLYCMGMQFGPNYFDSTLRIFGFNFYSILLSAVAVPYFFLNVTVPLYSHAK